MKSVLVALLLFISSTVWAVSIQWDESPFVYSVTQYKVYKAKSSGDVVVGTVNAPTTTLNVDTFLQGNRTTFYVTAVNFLGESLASAKVTVQRH